MEIEGMIIRDLGLQEGVSRAGNPWKKHEWVLETVGQYPRKVKFHVFGDRVDTLKFEVGKFYAVQFDLESREYNERWYTDVNAYNYRQIEAPAGPVMTQGPQPAAQAAPAPQAAAPSAPAQPGVSVNINENFYEGNSDEDLPF